MNLYEIILEHFSQKGSKRGIFTYLFANSNEEVYEWLKTNPTLKDGRWVVVCYEDSEKDGDTFEIYDNDYNIIGTETFKEKMIRLHGDLYDEDAELCDEDAELCDLYYGRTLIGWKLIKEDVKPDVLKIISDYNIAIEDARSIV
jgi:hypothetical protein